MKSQLSDQTADKLANLLTWLNKRPCVLAFSGGVDSSTLAKALVLAYSNTSSIKNESIPPIGYFAESFSSTTQERYDARKIASEIGIDLQIVSSNEFSNPNFICNSPKRCYWCKKTRFSMIKELANKHFTNEHTREITVIDGSNSDDLNDYRPGILAAREIGIRSPFAELGISKAEIRELASFWNLSIAGKPSNPCLVTRVAYNLELNEPLLRKIEEAEIAIKKILNADVCRARVDIPGVIRIELPERFIGHVFENNNRERLVKDLRDIGFNFVSLDLEGFFSGKNNRLIKE